MLQRPRATLFTALAGRIFYGWVVLGVAVLAMFGSGPGQSHLIGLFFDPIARDLELSRTSIATAYGLATLFAAFLLPQMGRMVDRHGPARLLWLIALGLGLACILFRFAGNWLYLAAGFALLRFLGQGALMLNCSNMVSQWFERRRGFALGLMGLGFPISIALHPPVVQWLIETVGWREAWIWLGVATIVILLPPILLLAYDRPEQVGLRPDGAIAATGPAPPITGLTLGQAVRTPAFYIITVGLFSLSMLVTGLHVEFTGILVSHGLAAQTAAAMFTITGLTAAIAMPIVGRMLDRLPTERVFAGGLVVMVGSLVSASLVDGVAGAVLYAAIFGINNGVTMTCFAYLWPHYFGRRHLGAIQGTGQMVGVVGASLGPLPLGIAIDYFGNYDTMLRLLAILPAACAVLALFLRAPKLPAAD